MRVLAAFLIGLGLADAAAAQTNSVRVEMEPLPQTMPMLLFAPEPIAGTMLKPFAPPQPGAMAEILPDGNVAAVEPAALQVEPDIAADPASAATATATPQGRAEPDAESGAGPETALAPLPGAIEAPDVTIPAPDAAPGTSSTVVHIIVENVGSNDGVVNVALCDSGLSEEGCPYKTSVPAVAGFVETMIDNIAPGTYAVVGYHDVNGNDEFDKFLGMPREPYALSSAAAESLVPTFSDAALSIHEGDNVVIIRLKTFGGG